MRNVCLFWLLMILLTPLNLIGGAERTADFYVAIQGNDQWSGKMAAPNGDKSDGPFRTLERARDAVRKLLGESQRKLDRAITVGVSGGVYTFNKSFELGLQDSGASDTPVSYRAIPGEQVILTGGSTLPADAFQPVDAKVQERLPPVARREVVQADLRRLGITDLGAFPVKFQGTPNCSPNCPDSSRFLSTGLAWFKMSFVLMFQRNHGPSGRSRPHPPTSANNSPNVLIFQYFGKDIFDAREKIECVSP